VDGDTREEGDRRSAGGEDQRLGVAVRGGGRGGRIPEGGEEAVGQCSLPPPLRPEAGEPSPALTPCSLSDTLILDRTLCRLVTLAAPAMFARPPRPPPPLTAVPFLVLAVAGCGKSRVEASDGEKRIRALGMMYLRYSTNNIGRKQSVEQFKQFIKKVPANELEPYGIQPADLDPLFVSPRD